MTPSETFFEVMDKYEVRAIEPLENWETDDLVELQEALRAELQERDRKAQEEYYEDDKTEEDGWFIDQDWECLDDSCSCHENYGGTDSE